MSWLDKHLPRELPGSWDATHGWPSSWLLPCIAMLVIAAYVVLARTAFGARLSERARQLWHGFLVGVLAATALASVVNYHDYGLLRYGSYMNEWDVFHYYLGTKYAPEIGYMQLYAATLVADDTEGLRYDNPLDHIRDLETVQYRAVDDVLADRDRYVAMFSPARWQEFVADVSWFKAQLPKDRWSELLTDHGYNGTPVWTSVIGSVVSNNLSIRDDAQRWIMLALDPLLLYVLFAAVGWAFGPRTALLAIVFVGTHYFLSWGHLKGCLVRTDFAVGLGLAVCLVRQGWYRLAGVCIGWAILSRVFPAIFLAPILARLGWIGFSERRLDRRLAELLVACAATGLFFVTLSLALHGTGLWLEWFEKITEHYVEMIHWNVGYQAIFDAEFQNGDPVLVDWMHRLSEEPELLVLHKSAFWLTAACIVLPGLVFTTSLRDHEALCMGFVFMFFTVQAAYYYFLLLIVPFLFFASEVERPSRAIGAAWMLATGMGGYLLFSGWPPLAHVSAAFKGWHQGFGTTYYMSWLLCITAIYMELLAARQALRARAPESSRMPLAGRQHVG